MSDIDEKIRNALMAEEDQKAIDEICTTVPGCSS